MAAKYILAALSLLFLALAIFGAAQGRPRPQTRTWLIVGVIFGVVAAWLFVQAPPEP
jgi:hypothetical protein